MGDHLVHVVAEVAVGLVFAWGLHEKNKAQDRVAAALQVELSQLKRDHSECSEALLAVKNELSLLRKAGEAYGR